MHEQPSEPVFVATRETLRLVATHVMARPQHATTGRIGLRAAPGGFATTEFGAAAQRIRVTRGVLVVESTADSGASSRAASIDGSSMDDLARMVGADLSTDFSAGRDTPALGDPQEVLQVNAASADLLGRWYAVVAEALDAVLAETDAWANPSRAQLWPEHFDLALDVAFDRSAPGDQRVNLGGSPGDESHQMPYLYVGPWTGDRPGDAEFWNAPFGAVMSSAQVLAADSPVDVAARFFRDGLRLLAR